MKKIIKLFQDGNVCVTGLRGRGKDMLMSNVVVRRKKEYISNVYYGEDVDFNFKFNALDHSKIDCGYNTYKDFISGKPKHYVFPYPDGTDIYISDAGVYYPSQYCSELNKAYPQIPNFMALSRHLGKCNVHFNVQNLNRCWDKIREQSDTYILCRRCIVIFGIVFQWVRIYDNPDACIKRVIPFPVKPRLTDSREVKTRIKMEHAMYTAQHGEIKNRFLIYRNKSDYDTRIFKTMLERGVKNENKS